MNGTGSKTSLIAVASLTSALLFFFPPAWLAAVILGVVALVEIKQSGGQKRGRGLAVAAIALSVVWTVVLVVLLVNAINAVPKDADYSLPPLSDESDADYALDEDYNAPTTPAAPTSATEAPASEAAPATAPAATEDAGTPPAPVPAGQ